MAPTARRSDQKRQRESQVNKPVWLRWLQPIQIGWRGFYTRRGSWYFGLVFTSLIFCLFSSSIAVLPGEEKGWPFANLTEALFDGPGRYFHRNLRVDGKTLIEKELSVEMAAALRSQDEGAKEEAIRYVIGLNLTNRDLRFADFRNAVLPKVDLRGANLDNARLEQADLSSADLRPLDIRGGGSCIQKTQEERLSSEEQNAADLIDVNLITKREKEERFCSTSLRKANLSAISLGDARLPYAQLEGATLRRADLSKTNLWRARLQNVDLWDARLREADLRYAQLQGAHLGNVHLQGADLSNAQLQGMSSMDMEAQGAIFESAQFQAATLLQARLQGAHLNNASLQGTRLESARLQGASLRGAKLQGSYLFGAQLQGADLGLSEIGGANFRVADLSLSYMADVDREPLTQKAYDELVKQINEAKVSSTARDGLRRLTRSVGQRDTLEQAIRADDMLCGWRYAAGPKPSVFFSHEPAFFKGCIPGEEFERYEQKLVPFLAKLGCSEPYVARGMYYRADSPDARSGGSTLGAELAKQLLDPNCEGGKSLSEKMKTTLRQIIESDKQMRSKQPPPKRSK
jgi:uncharacterized protein YjbI with pentapeptide repeats